MRTLQDLFLDSDSASVSDVLEVKHLLGARLSISNAYVLAAVVRAVVEADREREIDELSDAYEQSVIDASPESCPPPRCASCRRVEWQYRGEDDDPGDCPLCRAQRDAAEAQR